MDFETLTYEKQDMVAVICLNRPDNKNAIGPKGWEEVREAIQMADRDDEVMSVLLCGAGDVFCGGYDMDDSLSMKSDSVFYQWKLMQKERICGQALWDCNKPVVTAIHGTCLGSGFEIALLTDIIVSADDAAFGMPEVWYSMNPQPTLMYRMGFAKAKELLLLGDTFSAQQAYDWGLINYIVPREEMMAKAMHMARRLGSLPTEAVQITKRMINKVSDTMGYSDHMDWSFDLMHATKLMPTALEVEFEARVEKDGLQSAMAWMALRYSGNQ